MQIGASTRVTILIPLFIYAPLGKRFVATKNEFQAAMLSIMRSIQRSTELLLSFFQLPDTKYAAHAGY